MMMKVMRICVIVLTAIVAIAAGTVFVSEKIASDNTIPVLEVEDGVLDVSCSASDADLLEGVKAYDEKDGDITDRVIVESVGKFSKIGYCKVTYAVSDEDNHVVTAQRQVHYTDYTKPKFTMSSSLIFSVYDEMSVTGIIGAKDCLDGNISNNVIIYSPDYVDGEEGTYTIQATVTNSRGDSSEIDLPLVVEKLPRNSPQITLSDYLIYVKKGSKTPKWESYIESTTDYTGVENKLEISVETDFNAKKAGMYNVDFYGKDDYGNTGHTRLIVVVE